MNTTPFDLTVPLTNISIKGKQFKVTRERIRQIEATALRKMRHPTRLRQLEGFLESEGMM